MASATAPRGEWIPPVHFCLLLGIQTYVAMTGSRLLLSLYAIDVGAQPFAVGLLIATLQVVPLLVSLPVGRLADRYGTRYLLAIGFLASVTGLWMTWVWPTLTLFFVASALNGLLLGVNNVAMQSIMGVLSRPDERARNFSNLAVVGAACNFGGPLITGLAIDHLGYGGAILMLLAVAASGIASIVLMGGALPGGSGKPGRQTGKRGRLSLRLLWKLLLVSALAQLCTDLFLFYMPVYGRGIGLSATVIGVLSASFGAATVLVRAVTPNLLSRLGEVRLLGYSFGLAGLGFILTPLFGDPWMLATVCFLIGLGAGCGQPVTMMLVVARAPAGRSGEMLGLQLTANGLVRSGGPAVLGVVASFTGLGPVFVVSGLLMIFGALLTRGAASGG